MKYRIVNILIVTLAIFASTGCCRSLSELTSKDKAAGGEDIISGEPEVIFDFEPSFYVSDVYASADGSTWFVSGFESLDAEYHHMRGEEERCFAIINGETYGPYSGDPNIHPYAHPAEVIISDNGVSWAYWAQKEDKGFYAIIGGEEKGNFTGYGPDIDEAKHRHSLPKIYGDIIMSDDGSTYILSGGKPDGWYVVVNDEEWGPYEEVSDVEVSADGLSWGFKADGEWITNGADSREGEDIAPSSGEPDWGYVSRESSPEIGDYAIVNDEKHGPYALHTSIVFFSSEEYFGFYAIEKTGDCDYRLVRYRMPINR